jgi:eukaryotic-like serine/threonine-protein kinase
LNRLEVGRQAIDLVPIPSGEFLMGSSNEVFGEAPIHLVTIARPFWLSKFPITQTIWEETTGENPSYFSETKLLPVDSVSWDDAIQFCAQLSRRIGRSVRLPTESEWEYACRAGSENEFFMFTNPMAFVDGSSIPVSTALKVCDFGWFDLNSRNRTHPVGKKLPNRWGLYDMIGNVWEWCQDDWHDDYVGAPSDGSAWTGGDDQETRRCVRGGAWDMDAFRCRSTYRSYDDKRVATNRSGLRIAVEM